jgi:hypothetical protein
LGVHAAYSCLFFSAEIKEEADRDWAELHSPNEGLRIAHNARIVKERYAAASDDIKDRVAKYIEDRYTEETNEYVRITSGLENLNTDSWYVCWLGSTIPSVTHSVCINNQL